MDYAEHGGGCDLVESTRPNRPRLVSLGLIWVGVGGAVYGRVSVGPPVGWGGGSRLAGVCMWGGWVNGLVMLGRCRMSRGWG